MRIPRILMLVFIFSTARMAAQPAYNKADSAAVFSLIDKANIFYNKSHFDSALFYGGKAESLARDKKIYSGEAWALITTTEILIEAEQLDKADANSLLVNKLGIRLKDSLITAISILQRAQVKMYKNQYDTAIMLFDKSLRYKLNKANNEYTALAYNDLGYTWGLKAEFEKQAEYTVKALNIYEKLGIDEGAAMALGNLSTVYYQLGQKDKAIEYGKQGLKYREKAGDIEKMSLTCCNLSQYYLGINADEATKYQQLCVKYALQSGNEGRLIHSYVTSSLVANSKKNNKEALEYELKVIGLLEKSRSDQKMLARRYIAAAFYNDMLKLDSLTTLNYFNKSILLSRELNDRGNLKDLYWYLSEYYRRRKNHEEAYLNYKKHILYKDSIINADKEEIVAEIETRYETEKKDNEIARLNASQRIKQLEIEKQKALIAGNMLEAQKKENEIELLSKSRELQEVKIRQQDEELERQLLLAKNNEQALRLSQQEKEIRDKQLQSQKQFRNILIIGIALLITLAGVLFNRYQLKKKLQEQAALQAMRNNIASDLHDDIGASLSNINILNELAKRNAGNPERSTEYLGKAGEDIQRISESLSDIVWNINPKYDDLHNLFVRMKRYASDMLDGKNISYEMSFPEEADKISLSMERRRDFYLIFKEAVNNLIKYSKATSARVVVDADTNKVYMTVTDNGVGFNSDESQYGNGISNMKKRAEAWDDRLYIKSGPGKGTEVRLEMSTT